MIDTYRAVRDFEAALCDYTGAKYAVTTTSCTMAILLAVAYFMDQQRKVDQDRGANGPREVEVPKHTYVSVPMSIIHAGGKPTFRDEEWKGAYQLKPLPVWDCARRFTSGMFVRGQMQCLSFHWAKILGVQQGGCILHDNAAADWWLRRARFDGRSEGVHPMKDTFPMIGFHCYLAPEQAAAGLIRLALVKEHNEDLPNDAYPDLSQLDIFK